MRFCPRCRSIFTANVEFCGIDGSRVIEAADDPLVGREVDRYRVLERIGVGALGCVYRVQHSVLEKEHAMKILFGDLGQDRRLVERFKREAKAISKMRHPSVVTVSDFGRTENGLIFLVMELLRGPTLLDEIAAHAPLPPRRVAEILLQIAAGLAEAHRRGYVHRDVKPANIVLTGGSGPGSVKILDFGMIGLRTESLDARLTAIGFVVGTPAYMAPEQATDPSNLTPAADLYSLGVIAFQLLTGRLPFNADNALDLFIEHSTQPVPELPPSAGLERVVEWMLKKKAIERPQQAEQIVEVISRLEFEPDDDFDLLLTDPITYVGEIVLSGEALLSRLYRLQEVLLRAPFDADVRSSFESRVLRLLAEVKPELRGDRYRALGNEIEELEEELFEKARFRPA